LAKIHSKRDINKTQNPKKLKSIGKGKNMDINIDFLVNGKTEGGKINTHHTSYPVIKAPITQNPLENQKSTMTQTNSPKQIKHKTTKRKKKIRAYITNMADEW
jgi:hypothetical protein